MIDTKNAILIVIVLAVAGIVGLVIPYLQTRNIQQDPLPVATSTGPLTLVNYTNGGFDPRIVTVPVGTTVEWINASNKLMWVASDPHPAHTDLHGFDERGTEGNEESSAYQGSTLIPLAQAHSGMSEYRFTFTKIGTWGYHNHLDPSQGGTVIVE